MHSAGTVVWLNSAIAFGLGFVSILFIAAVARYGARYFASERASRVAGFSVAVGYALGHFSGTATRIEELPIVMASLGAVAGLGASWAWLLRRGVHELTDTDV
jgi:hypothetical protein